MAVIATDVGPAQTITTFAAWLVTLPGNVVTAGNSYVCNIIGQLADQNQALTGHNTNATFNITVTAKAGQSFIDNANRLTNALRYNSANGASWESGNGHSPMLAIADPYTTISRMQFYSTGQTLRLLFIDNTSNVTVEYCIIQSVQRNGQEVLLMGSSGGVVRNCLFVSMTSNAHGIRVDRSAVAVNCTIVRPSDIGPGSSDGFGTIGAYGTSTLRNCAVFGFFNSFTGSWTADGHNCTNLSTVAGSTSNLVSKTYANQFTNTVSTTQDWRLKTGADCINAGVTDTTNVPAANDIVVTARPSGASWDIGAWEFASAAAAYRARVVRWR